jgi:glyoxylase-like metal-dependent hydrolase (beta-lactamase superfamily II)
MTRLVFRTTHPSWLSNTWLCADREGGHAVLIDTGGPIRPILAQIEAWRVTVTHVLCTHHHHDHVAHNAEYRASYGCPVCGHGKERSLFEHLDLELGEGDELRSGDLRIRALHVPGHTLGQLAFLVDEAEVFTGDTLFRGSVGGTRAPGHTSYEDLKHSVLERLLRLPAATLVRPGHMDSTTVGREFAENPFVRFWRGLDPALDRPCTAFGEPATLLCRAIDYDGGTKCIVRFEDGDRLDVVPGSRVELDGG